jgi:hypothetical protein
VSDDGARVEGERPRADVVRLPRGLWVWGAAALIGSAVLAARLVWEQTVATWEEGPLMVGWSLAHGAGLLLLPFVFLLLAWVPAVAAFVVWRSRRQRRGSDRLLAGLALAAAVLVTLLVPFGSVVLWLIAAVVLMVWSFSGKRRIPGSAWAVAGLCGALLMVLALPYGFWQRLFVERLASGPHAAEFLTNAAALGDLRTVEAFLSHGVSVNARDSEGGTALHGAAVGGNLKTLEYLLAKGADIDALDRYGDSPLGRSQSGPSAEFLVARGAKSIRGDEAHRRKVTDEIVREASERFDKKRR